jgi:4-amino-4-deoxy-L-arabinose transferase-like glycosyltransferase
MSVWGFARIWITGDSSWVAPLLVYVGMGLAVQTKGLLGLCPAAAAALFWLVARPETERTRRLLHWPAILAGFAVGSFWYWIMLQRHGLGSMQDFFSDQVGTKVTYGPTLIAGNFAAYSLAGLRHFLPWTLLLLVVLIGGREEIVRWWRQHRRECVFLLSLYGILVILFSFGNIRRTRYLVAAYPMLAVLLAMMWSHAPFQQGRSRWFGRILNGVAAILLVLGAGLLAGGIGGDWRLAMGGGIWLAAGVLGVAAVRSVDEYWRQVWLAGVVVAVFVVVGASLRPAFSRVPIAPMVSELLRDQSGAAKVYSWRSSGSVDAMLRLVSGGRLEVKVLDADNPDFTLASRVIATSDLREQLSEAGYSLTAVTVTNAALAESWLGRLVARAEARRNKAAPTYWIAERVAAAP